jgi:hypothetical protein
VVLKDVGMMKFWNVLCIVAVGVTFIMIAYQADAPSEAKDPNPMKNNLEQFARMQVITQK